MTIQNLKFRLVPVLKGQGVLKASIFGSFARGDNTKRSDLDILVRLSRGKTLLDLAALKMKLEEVLKKKVDVITYNSIHPLLRESILKDEKVIYEKRS